MGRTVVGRVLLAAIASTVVLAHAGTAAGAGYLNEIACLGQPGSGCSEIDGNRVLDTPAQVLPSPDPHVAYAITSSSSCVGSGCPPDAISTLRRGADGRLSFDSCVSTTTTRGCSTPAHPDILEGLGDAVVGPEGRDLYVVSYFGESVVHFRLGTDGHTTYADCVGDASLGCTAMPDQEDLGQPVHLAISADGQDVYVLTSWGMVHLRRGAGGTLSVGDCSGWTTACMSPPTDCVSRVGLEPQCMAALYYTRPMSVAVAPDGRDVYVGFGDDAEPWGAIARYRRHADGSIAFVDCLGADVTGCRHLPAGSLALAGPKSLAFSPDGSQLYVGGSTGDLSGGGGIQPGNDMVTHLRRGADGELAFAECIGAPHSGCTPLAVGIRALARVTSVALSPDGQSLYAGAGADGALTHFTLGADGAPAFAGCWTSPWSPTLACRPGHGAGGAVSVSADGRNVYQAGTYVLPTYDRTLAAPAPAQGTPPTATTDAPPNVDTTSIEPAATVDPHGQPVNVTFEYGETTAYGRTTGLFSTSQTGPPWRIYGTMDHLAPATTYHYRVVVTSPAGTVRGADRAVTTSPWPSSTRPGPTAHTVGASGGTMSAVRLEGNVNPHGTATTAHFEWGTTTAYGHTTPDVSAGDATADQFVGQVISGLQPATTYHYHVVAHSG